MRAMTRERFVSPLQAFIIPRGLEHRMKCNKLKAKLKAVKRRIFLPLFVSGFSNLAQIFSILSGQQIRLWALEVVEPGLAAQAVLKSQVLHFFWFGPSAAQGADGPNTADRWSFWGTTISWPQFLRPGHIEVVNFSRGWWQGLLRWWPVSYVFLCPLCGWKNNGLIWNWWLIPTNSIRYLEIEGHSLRNMISLGEMNLPHPDTNYTPYTLVWQSKSSRNLDFISFLAGCVEYKK